MFPGGTGLWRGESYFGPLPSHFPRSPVMVVGHNFDSVRAFERSKQRGGEVQSRFWKVLLGFLHYSDIRPSDCFFTNVLMGVKNGSALGPMPKMPGYTAQCLRFFQEQIEIVNSRAIITLGGNARDLLARLALRVPIVNAKHPSARVFNPLATRDAQMRLQGDLIKSGLATEPNPEL